MTIKDSNAIKGEITTYGSRLYQDYRDEEDHIVVARLKRAGAILHARSATPEFSCAAFTHSLLWGVTRNPWNPDYTPGGSTGGGAAALAAGTATLANGSDIGGSIRIPASACGVVGFKPTFGRVPQSPPFNLDYYCHNGPLARTVGDCRLFQNVIAGPHKADVASIRPKQRIPALDGDISGWRIAVSMDLGYFEVDSEVQRNTLAAVEVLRGLGAQVETVDLGWSRRRGESRLQSPDSPLRRLHRRTDQKGPRGSVGLRARFCRGGGRNDGRGPAGFDGRKRAHVCKPGTGTGAQPHPDLPDPGPAGGQGGPQPPERPGSDQRQGTWTRTWGGV